MKKIWYMLLACMLLLAGCTQAPNPTVDPSVAPTESVTPITRVGEISTETHVLLDPIPYEVGEEQENLYYRKTNNLDGEYVYEVYTQDGELLQLPVSDTVLYLSEASNYVERVSFDYEINGETITAEQYWLFVEPAVADLSEDEANG